MVEMGFGGDDAVVCEGCGVELPAFLDECPYCSGDDEDDQTLPCPDCGAQIFELSEQCPVCGAWVSMRVSKKSSGSRFTGLAGRLLVLGLILLFIWGLMR